MTQISQCAILGKSDEFCPICFEIIGVENCVTTRCKHRFHCNCLLKSVLNLGNMCPLCRDNMHDDISLSEDTDDELSSSEVTESDHYPNALEVCFSFYILFLEKTKDEN